jgi:hypothetical protein
MWKTPRRSSGGIPSERRHHRHGERPDCRSQPGGARSTSSPTRSTAPACPVKVRLVRNDTGGLVLPGRLYAYDPAYPRRGSTRQTTVIASEEGWPVDELLPAAGVQNNDLVYVVVSGPALVYTARHAGAGNVINAGRPARRHRRRHQRGPGRRLDLGGATVGSTARANNRLGRAMSAATTGNTSTGILVMMESRW